MFRVQFSNLRDQPGFGNVYRRFTGRPGWVWGIALLIGVVPFAIVIALLAFMALLTTVIVFTILGLIDSAIQGVSRAFTGNEGRENVTVVQTKVTSDQPS